MNTRPFMPQMGVQHLLGITGELVIGHREITKVPQRSISWSAGPGYVTFKIGGQVPIIWGTICKFLSTPWPQGATRATQHMWEALISQGHVQVAVCPPPRPSGAGRRIFPFSRVWFQQSILSLDLQLNWTCSLVEQYFHRSWAPPPTPLI